MNTMQATKTDALARTVQDYIGETPVWRDGTAAGSIPLTVMQWRIWGLAAAGKFFEGAVVFTTGVALSLMAQEFGMDALQHGLVGAAALAGIPVGAVSLGSLTDRFGRRFMFIVEMVIFTLFPALLSASPGSVPTVVLLFGLGAALGCDYPTANLMISESIPSRTRGQMVIAAFGFRRRTVRHPGDDLVLANIADVAAWRLMYAVVVIPAILMVARFHVTDSPC